MTMPNAKHIARSFEELRAERLREQGQDPMTASREFPHDDRNMVLDLMQLGRMSIADGEVEARRRGWEPFEVETDPRDYHPEAEFYWSMPMALAWVSWRSLEMVTRHWNEFRSDQRAFHHGDVVRTPSGEQKWLPPQRQRPARVSEMLNDAPFAPDKGAPNLVPLGVAWKYLKTALRSGQLAAEARRADPGRLPCVVPAIEWAVLDFVERRLGEVLTDGVGLAYFDVTVLRENVMRLWWPALIEEPAREAAPRPPSDGPKPTVVKLAVSAAADALRIDPNISVADLLKGLRAAGFDKIRLSKRGFDQHVLKQARAAANLPVKGKRGPKPGRAHEA